MTTNTKPEVSAELPATALRTLRDGGPTLPRILIGCMRFTELEDKALDAHVAGCLEEGLNLFDHADIYGDGSCEERFAASVKRLGIRREELVLQSKCAIQLGVKYDLSKEYILRSVEGNLKRLGTDHLDLLLLHRSDALVEPEEVAEAFETLAASGKVLHFGVSNHTAGQLRLLQKYVRQPLVANQLQFGLGHAGLVAAGIETNMLTPGSVLHDDGVLDYCRLENICIQAWSPFQYGFFDGVIFGNQERYKALNFKLEELAGKYGVTPMAVATAWILRHPARMMVVAGTTKRSRLQEMKAAFGVELSREDWYALYMAAGYPLP